MFSAEKSLVLQRLRQLQHQTFVQCSYGKEFYNRGFDKSFTGAMIRPVTFTIFFGGYHDIIGIELGDR